MTICKGAAACGSGRLVPGDTAAKIQGGIRGNSSKDIEGRLMRPMARILTDEDAIRNVMAYLDTLNP